MPRACCLAIEPLIASLIQDRCYQESLLSKNMPHGAVDPPIDIVLGGPFLDAEQHLQMRIAAQQFQKLFRRAARIGDLQIRIALVAHEESFQRVDTGLRTGLIEELSEFWKAPAFRNHDPMQLLSLIHI